ncbi:MAG TPA: type II toxin-antitoxin system prevent-host-death family antitoxin [Thermomicrobiaceae bacterium]|nr:type II toxin-antitoxin system prevent-host-death family antitoxin [Thermomicrobiaceae bacterium]
MTIGAAAARTHFSRLLREVEEGKSITITRRGTPAARLVPISQPDRTQVQETIEEIRAFRRGRSLGGIRLRDLIEEGRRY